ncbi:hypothetical protein V1522DRAFT_437200 [Lipomyces starkeyi]
MNYRNRQHSTQLSVILSNENIIVRYSIRTQKIHGPGTMDKCNCATRIRYLLPCSHQIQLGVPLQVAQVHPRWRIQGALPALTVPNQNLDSSAIADIKDIAVLVKRKGRPRGTRRLAISAEIVQRAADRTERVRRCGSCRRFGHTRRTCPIRKTREGQSGFSASLTSANDASIQVEQLQDVDIGTGKEDDPPETNDEDGSTLEEMWTDILSTIEQVNGNDGSEHAK